MRPSPLVTPSTAPSEVEITRFRVFENKQRVTVSRTYEQMDGQTDEETLL